MEIKTIDYIEFDDGKKILDFFSSENDLLARFVKIYKNNMENRLNIALEDGAWGTSKLPITISTNGSQYIKLLVLGCNYHIKYNTTKSDVIRGVSFVNMLNINCQDFIIIPEICQKCYYIVYRSIKKLEN